MHLGIDMTSNNFEASRAFINRRRGGEGADAKLYRLHKARLFKPRILRCLGSHFANRRLDAGAAPSLVLCRLARPTLNPHLPGMRARTGDARRGCRFCWLTFELLKSQP
jgi:hypothetical protein